MRRAARILAKRYHLRPNTILSIIRYGTGNTSPKNRKKPPSCASEAGGDAFPFPSSETLANGEKTPSKAVSCVIPPTPRAEKPPSRGVERGGDGSSPPSSETLAEAKRTPSETIFPAIPIPPAEALPPALQSREIQAILDEWRRAIEKVQLRPVLQKVRKRETISAEERAELRDAARTIAMLCRVMSDTVRSWQVIIDARTSSPIHPPGTCVPLEEYRRVIIQTEERLKNALRKALETCDLCEQCRYRLLGRMQI